MDFFQVNFKILDFFFEDIIKSFQGTLLISDIFLESFGVKRSNVPYKSSLKKKD